jgi:hypothetical protein
LPGSVLVPATGGCLASVEIADVTAVTMSAVDDADLDAACSLWGGPAVT